MTRLILTFNTLFQVLAANKALKDHLSCRPIPTPNEISDSSCSISLEILQNEKLEYAIDILSGLSIQAPRIHHLSKD